jgi:hypothetical protein
VCGKIFVRSWFLISEAFQWSKYLKKRAKKNSRACETIASSNERTDDEELTGCHEAVSTNA